MVLSCQVVDKYYFTTIKSYEELHQDSLGKLIHQYYTK